MINLKDLKVGYWYLIRMAADALNGYESWEGRAKLIYKHPNRKPEFECEDGQVGDFAPHEIIKELYPDRCFEVLDAICHKIYIARNITLDEKEIIWCLEEIDRIYKDRENYN